MGTIYTLIYKLCTVHTNSQNSTTTINSTQKTSRDHDHDTKTKALIFSKLACAGGARAASCRAVRAAQ